MFRNFPSRASAWASILSLALAALPVAAQLSNSKHNLTSGGPGMMRSSRLEDMCVFCHTPMGAEASAAAPQWNEASPAPAAYQTYDTLGTSALSGKVAPVGSVSFACLACHDGTQAVSTVISARLLGWAEGSWGGVQPVGGLAVGFSSNIGTDLRNDHPIGVQYGGGGITANSPSAPTHNPDFRSPQSSVLNDIRIWWVETGVGAAGTRRKTDLSLYTRTRTDRNTGLTVSEPYVECASCHDPHTDNTLFLRVSNSRNALCLACHIV